MIVEQQFINMNRSYEGFSPQGWVVHSTATPGATAQNERTYFNTHDVSASAHAVSDWDKIIEMVPSNEVAWHAGWTANHKFKGIEMCEPNGDPILFEKVWKNTVEYIATDMQKNGWGVDRLYTHYDMSNIYGETDHSDPIGYFAQYGKTWADFVNDIKNFSKESKPKGEVDMPQPIPMDNDKTKWQGYMNFVAFPDSALLIAVSSGDAPGVPEPKGQIADVTIFVTDGKRWIPQPSVKLGAAGPTYIWRKQGYNGQVVVDSSGSSLVVQAV